jgi:nicotinamidase-related amidase
MQRLIPPTTALLVVDVQERLASAMPPDALAELHRAARILVEGARLLQVPVFFTEQYPKGLGATTSPLDVALAQASAARFEKLSFSAWAAAGFSAALRLSGASSVVLIGMEAHVCVYQTARDLVNAGYDVHVPLDGVASRRGDHRETGLALCERAGAVRTTSETVLFDWLGQAGSEVFKEIARLLR